MNSVGNQAPELRVPIWIDAEGKPRAALELADLGPGYKILFCFQHWCPGCHSSGFPTLRPLVDALSDKGFGFAVIQTVFEGAEENTVERLREEQLRYGLKLPFGHDPMRDGGHYPTMMEDYATGGTPWFILIDPMGSILFSNFHFDADHFLHALGLKAASPA
jgi:hypothetical protein